MGKIDIMIAAAVLVLVVTAYRIILGMAGATEFTWVHNFSPLAAVALCGAIYFPRRVAILFPLGALFLSNLWLNHFYGRALLTPEMLAQYVALGLICALGWALRGRARTWKVLAASMAGSVLFYVITNTGSWWSEPAYAKTLSGWVQALTVGLPQYPPTLVFFRNSLLSDLAFTLLFLACVAVGRTPSERERAEGLRAQFARRLW